MCEKMRIAARQRVRKPRICSTVQADSLADAAGSKRPPMSRRSHFGLRLVWATAGSLTAPSGQRSRIAFYPSARFTPGRPPQATIIRIIPGRSTPQSVGVFHRIMIGLSDLATITCHHRA